MLWPCGRFGLLGVSLLLSVTVASMARGETPADTRPVISPQQIEADWLRQEEVRWLPRTPRSRPGVSRAAVTARQDAAGGNDGVKDGTYGFHTNQDAKPWWQVDLGTALPLDRVVIYNRCDGKVEYRAARLIVLLSADGKTWTEHYRHDGASFLGQTDDKPLVVSAAGKTARFVRVQLAESQYFHLDEVEVYRTGSEKNVAVGRPADQSSASQWSRNSLPPTAIAEADSPKIPAAAYRVEEAIEHGLALAADLTVRGVHVESHVRTLREISAKLPENPPTETRRKLYLEARWTVRRMALANPLLDFDDLLFVKRVPGTFTHMSDQYYGWWSRPCGGLCVLEDFKTDNPRLRCLTEDFEPGSVLRPDLSHDGTRVVFAYCKYYPGLRAEPDKLNKENVPEDAFYQLYEMSLDGSGVRRLTRGKYDSFDGRYLPSGEIVFLSTRRGQQVRYERSSDRADVDGAAPDCYVRCGGGPSRPVAVYTLHTMAADGSNLRPISPFEMFEWTPSVDHDGRILYARWDYVDRHNMPYMSLWSTMPDGTGAKAVFGNFTRNPHCVFEARPIPGSTKLIFTASGHHANTGGSLVLLDTSRGIDGDAPMTRLTPEVGFPETEGWSKSYFANPYPLAEEHYLVAWSDKEMIGWPGPPEPVNAHGVYLFDTFGNLELIYRDPTISSMTPLPIRPRAVPFEVASVVAADAPEEARMLVADVYQGLPTIPRGTIRKLRLVGVPAKTHPTMNSPVLGVTRDDPGKFVLGTVPVEADGSAWFHVPAGVTLFMQALDERGIAVQTMRSAAYLQPGETHTCVGCHEPRHTAPPNRLPSAAWREPSPITPGPEGSWPLDFQTLVQPVLQQHCVECHRPGTKGEKFDLTAARSYDSLIGYGKPSLRDHVMARYNEGRSKAGECAAQRSPVLALIEKGHYDVALDDDAHRRLTTWMDTYGYRTGSFDAAQQEQLRELRRRLSGILAESR